MYTDQLLRERGLRVTKPRLAVLEVLASGGHFNVDDIVHQIRDRLDGVSTQAVYDVLAALTRAGLARRVEPAGQPAHYEVRTAENHHHAVCRSCGTIADVACIPGNTPCVTPPHSDGFVIEDVEVTYWGLCPACQQITNE